VLIIGSISGDEPGGIAVASALATCRTIPGVDLWLLPDMNPDGLGARTRVNANGVDLNRNFPFSWRPLGPKGSRNYAGPRPLSEPESASVAALIRRIRPTVGVWFHQPYGLIDDSQGPQTFEHSLALLANLPEAKLPDFPGSAIGWEDHLFRNSAFDVELPGALSLTAIARDAQALYTVASTLTPRRGG
jgi:protein MpaA